MTIPLLLQDTITTLRVHTTEDHPHFLGSIFSPSWELNICAEKKKKVYAKYRWIFRKLLLGLFETQAEITFPVADDVGEVQACLAGFVACPMPLLSVSIRSQENF